MTKIAAVVLVSLLLAGYARSGDLDSTPFMLETGSREIASGVTLQLEGGDGLGTVRYSLRKVAADGNRTLSYRGQIEAQKDRFVFYWDDAAETLWYASREYVGDIGPGGSHVDGNLPKPCERCPELFRREILKVFPAGLPR